MPRRPLILLALIACAPMIANCAGFRPPSSGVRPPQLTLPATAATPCALPTLPDDPTVADLEAGYAQRGAALVACEAARRLVVETLAAERALIRSAGR